MDGLYMRAYGERIEQVDAFGHMWTMFAVVVDHVPGSPILPGSDAVYSIAVRNENIWGALVSLSVSRF